MSDTPQPALPAPEPHLLLEGPKPREHGWQRRWREHPGRVVAAVAVALLLLAFIGGWWLHHRRAQAAEDATREAQRMPLVTAIQASRSSNLGELVLPG
ncbi:MAG TPA: hypothetical protein VH328_07510, partial [Burkholderiaceae bacterium]|nr:hypothetical protein [Burkholderiaceae bacterium]